MCQFDNGVVFYLLLLLLVAQRHQTLIEVILEHEKLQSQLFTPHLYSYLLAHESYRIRQQVNDFGAYDLCRDKQS